MSTDDGGHPRSRSRSPSAYRQDRQDRHDRQGSRSGKLLQRTAPTWWNTSSRVSGRVGRDSGTMPNRDQARQDGNRSGREPTPKQSAQARGSIVLAILGVEEDRLDPLGPARPGLIRHDWGKESPSMAFVIVTYIHSIVTTAHSKTTVLGKKERKKETHANAHAHLCPMPTTHAPCPLPPPPHAAFRGYMCRMGMGIGLRCRAGGRTD